MSFVKYVGVIRDFKYFWLHLSSADLKYKFRRPKLELLWIVVNPFALTLMLTFIFGNTVNIPMKGYELYLFLAPLVWDFIIIGVLVWCNSLISAESYIRQFKLFFVI